MKKSNWSLTHDPFPPIFFTGITQCNTSPETLPKLQLTIESEKLLQNSFLLISLKFRKKKIKANPNTVYCRLVYSNCLVGYHHHYYHYISLNLRLHFSKSCRYRYWKSSSVIVWIFKKAKKYQVGLPDTQSFYMMFCNGIDQKFQHH